MPHKHKPFTRPYPLSRYGHQLSPRSYAGPPRPVRLRGGFSPTLEQILFCVTYATALAVVFFDVQVWRP